MPIRSMLENAAFSPEEVELLVLAHEKALSVLALKNRDDFATRTVARRIIKVAQQVPERDPEQICRRAVEELGTSRAA